MGYVTPGANNSASQSASPGVPASEPNVSSSTDLSGATASDPSESIAHRVSKRSLRRRASATSSKRSHNAAAQMNEKTTDPTAGSNTQTQPRAKKKSKFLSFLCCGSPDETAEAGQEPTPAARQSGVPQAASQTTPSTQPTATQSENSTDAANLLDEKAEKEPPLPTLPTDKPMPNLPNNTQSSSTAAAPDAVSQLPSGAEGDAAGSGIPKQETSAMAGGNASSQLAPNVVVQAATPITTSSEDLLIADRTPEQQARDTDIEMTDVGPSLPLSANDVAGTSEDERSPVITQNETHKPIDLPPPPPLEERQAQVIAHESDIPNHDQSLASSPELQKWLLPAARPEHKGRKCLVLDLDETLVHSSFKVRQTVDRIQAAPAPTLTCTH